MNNNILLISHNVLSKEASNGKTLSSIFSNHIKTGQVSQLYFSNEKISEDYKDLQFYNIYEFKLFRNLLKNLFTNNKHSNTLKIYTKPSFTYLIRDMYWMVFIYNFQIYKWIKKIKPTSVFFVTSNNCFSYKIAYNISIKFKIPLFLFFTDDYLKIQFSINPFYLIHKLSLIKIFNKSILISKNRFVIGEEMKLEYEKRYGTDFQFIMNLPDNFKRFDKFNTTTTTNNNNNKVIKFIYAGNLYYNRWKTLLYIAEKLFILNNQYKFNIIFEIYSGQEPNLKFIKNLKLYDNVFYFGFLNSNDLKTKIYNANYVLHVEDFSTKHLKYTDLSVSTKISEYIYLDKNIIAFGNIKNASIKNLKNNELAFVCHEKELIYNTCLDAIFNLVSLKLHNINRSAYVTKFYNFQIDNYI